jgi:hypothetical protein
VFKIIRENKLNILKAWQDRLLSSFSEKSAPFLNNPDPFQNPMGAMIPKMLETLFDQVTGEMDSNVILSALDDFIKVSAVQECAPSRALVFLHHLKNIVHSLCHGPGQGQKDSIEYKILEDRIDDILLKSFDIYMKCRESICTVRINEFKKRAFRVLENVQ